DFLLVRFSDLSGIFPGLPLIFAGALCLRAMICGTIIYREENLGGPQHLATKSSSEKCRTQRPRPESIALSEGCDQGTFLFARALTSRASGAARRHLWQYSSRDPCGP